MNNYFSALALKEETAATFEFTAVDAYRRQRGEEHCSLRYQFGDVACDMEQLQRAIINDSIINDSIGSEYYFMVRDRGTWLTDNVEFLNAITNQYDNYDLYGVNIYIQDGESVYKTFSFDAVRDGKKF